MKKILKQSVTNVFSRFSFSIMAMIIAVFFSSCTEDQDKAKTLSGTWKGDLGVYLYSDYYGDYYDAYETIIQFSSNGIGSTTGTGYELDRYSGAPWGDYIFNPIQWSVNNGVITIYYPQEDYTVRIYDYSLSDYNFYGRMEDNTQFDLTYVSDFDWSPYYDYSKTRGTSASDMSKYKMGCRHNSKK